MTQLMLRSERNSQNLVQTDALSGLVILQAVTRGHARMMSYPSRNA